MNKAANYAKAFYELSITEEMIDEVLEMIGESKELEAILADPTIFYKHKEKIIKEIFARFGGKTILKNAVLYLCKNGQLGDLPEIKDELCKYHEFKEKILRAKISCVVEPTTDQKNRICNWLKREFDKQDVILEIEKDQTLLGGFVISAEGKVFDRSVLGSISQLRNKTTGTFGGK